MNHKRGRPKNRRAGCLLCKPHKANGAKGKEKAKYRFGVQIEDFDPAKGGFNPPCPVQGSV